MPCTWEKEQEALLARLNDEGKTAREICQFLPHLSASAIQQKRRRLGLKPKRKNLWTPEEKEVIEKYSECLPVEAIAKRLKRTKLATSRQASLLGLSLKTTLDYWSPAELARIIGVSRKTVYTWINKGYLKGFLFKKKPVRKIRISKQQFQKFYNDYADKILVLKKIDDGTIKWLSDR